MAENLRFDAPGSVFYNDDPSNGPIYGKLYNWNTAMNGAAPASANPSGEPGIFSSLVTTIRLNWPVHIKKVVALSGA